LILSLRFLYGLRIAGPIALGMTEVTWLRYLTLNLIGAVVWSVLIAGLGYLFGNALALFLGDIQRYEGWVFFALAMGGIIIWFIHLIGVRRRRLNKL
jgi:membrane protein DedA with SNARE-associated domain